MSQQDMDLLLWLHAEAVWLARYEDEDGNEERTLPDLIALLRTRHELARRLYVEAEKDHKQSEASRRDWAAEATRLQHEADDAEQKPYWEFPHEWTDGGGGDPWNRIRSHCGACGRAYDDERHDEPFGQPPSDPEPGAPCSCLTAEGAAFVAAQPKWSLPLCAVHPEADR